MNRRAVLPESDLRAIASLLTQALSKLELPDGYVAEFDEEAEVRFALQIGFANFSVLLRNPVKDFAATDQVHGEIRLHLDRPRATLWLDQGPREGWKATSLLSDDERFIYGGTYTEVIDRAIEIFNTHLGSL
jgi:hypothetical protein